MATCTNCAPERNNPCPEYPNTNCIVYTGADLTCISVKTNDRLNTILSKINSAICSSGGSSLYLAAGQNITITGSGTLESPKTISAPSQFSITSDSGGLKFVNDSNLPGNRKVYSTSSSGIKGWRSLELADISDYVSSDGYTIVPVTTSPYNITQTSGDIIFLIDCSSGNIIMNLASAVGNSAKYTFKKQDSSANIITLNGNFSETIDGELSAEIKYQNSRTSMIPYDGNWYIIE